MKRHFKSVLLIISMAVLCIAVFNTSNIVYAEESQETISTSWDELYNMGKNSDTRDFFCDQLTTFEKGFYEYQKTLSEDMDRFATSEQGIVIVITGIPEDAGNLIPQLSRSHSALLADNPIYRMKWDRTFWSEKVDENNKSLYKVHMWKCSLYTERRFQKALNKADDLINALDESDDLYTKYTKLARYAGTHFMYDSDSYQQNSDWPYYGATYNDSAYGLLITNYAICAGFADTVKILCDKAGIPCIIAGNNAHAWNYIKMEDGNWYGVDNFGKQIQGRQSMQYDPDSMYIGSPGDFSFPDLSDNDYQYQGDNNDFSINVIENNNEIGGEGFLYTVNEDSKTCTITGYEGTVSDDFAISKTIDGFIVTAIGTEAFYRAPIKGKLVIPNSVKEIRPYAFKGCKGITLVEFPKSLEAIGEGAFVGCDSLSGVLVLPESLKNIGNDAFSNCTNIGDTLYIPNETVIGEGAFNNCGICEYIIDPDNENYSIYEGALYFKDSKTLFLCPEGKSGKLIIKEGTEVVADKACKNCTKLSGVVFPESLKLIGDYSFQDTCFTGELVLPDRVEEIGYCAFARTGTNKFDCELVLPGQLKDLRAWSFLNCGFKGEVIIPFGVERIGCELDWDDSDTSRFVFEGNDFSSYRVLCNNRAVKDYISKVEAGSDYSKMKICHPVCGITDISIGDNCSVCGETVDAFANEDTEHSLCEIAPAEPNCTKKGNSRYWVCRKCGNYYSDKSGKTKISKEQTIRKETGHNWVEEKRINNAEYAGVINIIYSCKDCGATTTKFSVSDNNGKYSVYDGALYSSDGKTLLLCPADKNGNLEIKYGTKTIADNACENCSYLTSVSFPDSLEIIGNSAFARTGIEEVTIPSSVKEIGGLAFCELSSLKHLSFSESNTLEIIGPYAFVNCDFIGDLIIPDSVKEIGSSAFQRSGLYRAEGILHLPENLEKLGSFAFSDCGFTGQLRIPDGIKEINLDMTGGVDYPAIFRGNDFSKYEVFCNNTKVQDYIREELTEYNVNIELLKIVHQSPICTVSDGMTCALCGETIKSRDDIALAGHRLTEHAATEATCTKAGNERYWSCEECGKFFSDKEGQTEIPKDSWIIAKEHSWNEGVVTTEPTCTAKGLKTFTCSKCGETKSEEIEEIGHSFDEEFTVDVVPTCTTEGSKSKHCVNCDEKAEVTAINAIGHSFGASEEVTSGTCDGENIIKRSCDICGFTETEPSDPQGHEWEEEYTVDIPVTCITDGSKSIHCKNCDVNKDSKVIPASGHSYGEWNASKEATCTESSTKEKVCAVCGDKIIKETSALGHAWNTEPTIDKAATCKDSGTQSIHCARCNETKDVKTIPAKGHTETLKNEVAASCTEKGYSGDRYCSDCGELLSKGSTVDALGHKKIAVKTVAATCQASGMKAHNECERCGIFLDKKGKILTSKAKKKLNIKKKNHNYKEKKLDAEHLKSAATCTKPAVYYYSCKLCHQKGKKTFKSGKALGHKYERAITKATPAKNGSIGQKCTVCGKKGKGKVIPRASKIAIVKKYKKKGVPASVIAAGGNYIEVKNSKGKKISKSEYDIAFNNDVEAGKGSATVTFKGDNYEGIKTINYKIVK